MKGKKLPSGARGGYKPGMKKSLLLLALTAAIPAQAQAPIKVLYSGDAPGLNGWLADKAIRAALDKPDFASQARPDAGVLVVTVSERVMHDPGENSTGFDFTMHFTRDGDILGEAQERCSTRRLGACADLVAEDVRGASAIHR